MFVSALMLTAAAPCAAQEQPAPDYEFRSHWYLSLHGGVQHTLGEAKFGDLLSPNVQLGAGWQLAPWFGARLSVGAWQSKGGFNGYTDGGAARNITYKYNYVAPAIDFMFSLSDALCGFNPRRVVSVSAFVGGGAAIAFGNDEANDISRQGYTLAYLWDGTKVLPVGRGGVALDFRLSDAVSLGIEGSANVTGDRYNSKKAGNADWYFNVLAGVKVNLGKSYRKPVPAPLPVREPEPVREVPAGKPQPAPQPEVRKVEDIRRDIFFRINSYEISDAEAVKIAELADYLKANAGRRLSVTGYADAQTGTDAVNDRLSRKRAESVVRMLVEKHNIARERITADSKGARVQPFAENDLNRVSVCVTAE